jgi:uncharacterized protein YkwD
VTRIVALLAGALPITLAPAAARADLLGAINSVRAQGCEGRPAARALLSNDARLNAAAAGVAQSLALPEALREARYRGTRSMVISVDGLTDETAIARFVGERYCSQLGDPVYRDIGIHRQGLSTWIVLAAPFAAPSASDAPAVSARVLALVNQARSQPRVCGTQRFAATKPLRSSAMLEAAARAHAQDMAERGALSHEGRDGSSVGDRVTRLRYAWGAVGENVAGGVTSAEAAVQGWIASPGHCANVMNSRYTEMGVGFAVNTATELGIYWTQVFAAPR